MREYDDNWLHFDSDKPWDERTIGEKWEKLWFMVRKDGERGRALRLMNELLTDQVLRGNNQIPDEAIALLIVLTDSKNERIDVKLEVRKKIKPKHMRRQEGDFKRTRKVQEEMSRRGLTLEAAIKSLYPDISSYNARVYKERFRLPYPRKLFAPWDDVIMAIRERA